MNKKKSITNLVYKQIYMQSKSEKGKLNVEKNYF